MTWENELGELVGRPARESELESNNLVNTGSANPRVNNPAPNLNPVNTETAIQADNTTPKTPNPAPAENPAQNPAAQNPASDPAEDPASKNLASEGPASDPTKKPTIPFLELRKLRKPGKGVQMTLYKDV